MKLYYAPASGPARRVRITAILLGINLETEVVDVLRGAGQQPEFLRLNPNGKVPTLVDGDFVLWESNAIMQYLAGKCPGTALYPDDIRARADITRWQSWHLAHFGPAVAVYVAENLFKPLRGLAPDTAALAKVEVEFNRYAKVIDDHLSTRTWLLGDTLTLADISAGTGLMYAEAGRVPLGAYPNIRRWFSQLQALPAWAKTEPPILGGGQ